MRICNTGYVFTLEDGTVQHDVRCELDGGHGDGWTHQRTLPNGAQLLWRARPGTLTTKHADGEITVEAMS